MGNPGVTRRNVTGKVSGRLESARLRVARKRMWLSTMQAVAYHAVHTARPFFDDSVKFRPIVGMRHAIAEGCVSSKSRHTCTPPLFRQFCEPTLLEFLDENRDSWMCVCRFRSGGNLR